MIKNIILFSVLFLAAIITVEAQVEVSTLAGDDSGGSLIAAIKSANTQKADPEKPIVIRFNRRLAGEIVLTMDLPAIENHISFVGNVDNNGKPTIAINGSVNPAINQGLLGGVSPGFGLFTVKSGKTVSFENLHLTKSNKSGIINEGGAVTVKNCMLTYNMGIGSINGTAGAIHSENGNLTVIGSYFFYNTGGVGSTDGGLGYGGSGCIDVINGNAVVINSSFLENEGGFGGVGVGSVGGAGVLMARDGNVTVVNCTVAGNFGGGCFVAGASGGFVLFGGNMSVLQSTIVDNRGGTGVGGFGGIDFCSGGIHVLAGILHLGGNIIAGNENGTDEKTDVESQVTGEVRSLGNNLGGIVTVDFNAAGDVTGVAMQNVVATTSEGKHQSEVVSGFLPTVALTASSPAKNKSVAITNISPLPSGDSNVKFFADAWSKYASLLQSDQNGKRRAANPSIGAVE